MALVKRSGGKEGPWKNSEVWLWGRVIYLLVSPADYLLLLNSALSLFSSTSPVAQLCFGPGYDIISMVALQVSVAYSLVCCKK